MKRQILLILVLCTLFLNPYLCICLLVLLASSWSWEIHRLIKLAVEIADKNKELLSEINSLMTREFDKQEGWRTEEQ